ncbi:MAG TPA: 4-hydroxy-tetrahydrodipicolinate synthase [Actinomycetota bacterium]|jgi:4-hydroxy-tetrahydrodipicolinate synthase|nr:4-hydroxy-tetrahydrodipicolinate synthase [Actinomycetota bacterium]
MKTPRFGELLTAMVTPFASDGSLDVKAARRLASHLVDHGSDGLVVCGTTGESPTVSHDEKLDLFESVLDEVGDRATIVAGTGTYDTAESVELTREAASLGVHACLVVTPYYSRPPQNGLLAHFRTVADAASVPLILYDIPGRTGRRIERDTLVELASHENIVAVKDAIGDAGETAAVRAALDRAGASDFEIYSGDDPLLLPHLAAGARGIVSVCSHLVGDQIKSILAAWRGGDVAGAQQTYLSLLPLFKVIMGVTSSPIPVKAALGMLGQEVGDPRPPLVPPTSDESAAIRAALEEAGLL